MLYVLTQANEVYIGTTINKKYKVKEIGSRKTILLPKDEWNRVLNTHESIVSKELFISVQKTFRRQNPKQMRNKNTNEEGMLKGKLKCGICKYSMDLIQGKEPYYQCTSRRFIPNAKCSKEHAECKVLENCIQTILSIYQSVFYSDVDTQRIVPRTETTDKAMRGEIKQIQLKEAKLYNNYKNNLLCKDEYLRKKEILREKQLTHQWKNRTLIQTKEKDTFIPSFIIAIYFYGAKQIEVVISRRDPCLECF